MSQDYFKDGQIKLLGNIQGIDVTLNYCGDVGNCFYYIFTQTFELRLSTERASMLFYSLYFRLKTYSYLL